MSNQIEHRHLRYFLTVAEELHFHKAAEKLFITQPALSRQILQLEKYLNTELLIRDKRNVSLTKAGEYFYEEAKFILNHIDFVTKNVQHLNRGDIGELRIGFVGSAMQNVIPDLLTSINKEAPGIHTVLTELPNQEQIDKLRDDQLDLGFIRSMRVPDGLKKHDVLTETFCIVLPKNHPIDEATFKSVQQFKEDHFILFSSKYSHGYYDKIMSIFEDEGFTPKVTHESVHANTIFRLVENGLGLAIIPSSLKHGFNLNIKFIDLKHIKQRTTLSAVWKDNHRNPVLNRVIPYL
ncbi:LysR family transcriptional regulator [Balneola vulgaris]|jgi:DNA-binding transcriptional LysR family regulator|uniref:LysR family transcriptional regulator n=1 Tax=Balneola vulgaris TaxID=287535 RepID=UPI00037FA942|nr:LysR family transcriptional regulator [Balneola vulgaris]